MRLVERTGQLATLQSACERSSRGTVVVALVEGAAGTGKTTLLDSFLDLVEASGAATIRASATGWVDVPPLDAMSRLLVGIGQVTDRADVAMDRASRQGLDVVEGFASALCELAAERSVVVAVDDIHSVDAGSLDCLLQVVRRARSARALLVLTQLSAELFRVPLVGAELIRLPVVETVSVEPLSPAGVAEVIAADEPRLTDTGDAAWFHRLSGGNPLLVRALLEDHRAASATCGQQREHAPGRVYRQTLMACLRRGERHVAEVAAGVAILGAYGSADRLGQLLGLPSTLVSRTLGALRAGSILDGDAFRHAAAADVALDNVSPQRRAELHRRAATLLYSGGAPVTAIAGHLPAVADLDGTWGVTALQDAAEQALAVDESAQAISFLELARRHCQTPSRRLAITLRLAAMARRTSLTAAEQHLAEPLAALRQNRLPSELGDELARQLAAQGRLEEGREVWERHASADGPEPAGVGPTSTLSAKFQGPLLGPVQALRTQLPSSFEPAEPSVIADDIAATFSEEISGVAPLTDATVDTIVAALRTLRAHGRLDTALRWSRSLADEAASRSLPGWQALFLHESAATSLRGGDLATAEACARAALDHIEEPEGSVFVRAPLAILVLVCLHRGRVDEAAAHLGRSVSGATLTSEPGVAYRRARGRYYLATNRVHAALSDFLHVGQMAERWGLDDLSVPWRTDAAEALLRLGAKDQAERLLAEQLSRRGNGDAWGRGVALRLRATLASADRRLNVLLDAVDELERSGDQIELAHVLADLVEAHDQAGDPAAAHGALRRARRLAHECGAESLGRRLGEGDDVGARSSAHDNEGLPEQPRRDVIDLTQPSTDGPQLTPREREVLERLGGGVSNRRISISLGISEHTVRTHLQTIFRKLGVSQRTEAVVLAYRLGLLASPQDSGAVHE